MTLAIFLPIVRVRLAPLPRTLQTDLLINRIGSYLPAMIIAAPLSLAIGLTANSLLRVIRVSAKRLPAIKTAPIFHLSSVPPALRIDGIPCLWGRCGCCPLIRLWLKTPHSCAQTVVHEIDGCSGGIATGISLRHALRHAVVQMWWSVDKATDYVALKDSGSAKNPPGSLSTT
jgi:hypothetical protein